MYATGIQSIALLRRPPRPQSWREQQWEPSRPCTQAWVSAEASNSPPKAEVTHSPPAPPPEARLPRSPRSPPCASSRSACPSRPSRREKTTTCLPARFSPLSQLWRPCWSSASSQVPRCTRRQIEIYGHRCLRSSPRTRMTALVPVPSGSRRLLVVAVCWRRPAVCAVQPRRRERRRSQRGYLVCLWCSATGVSILPIWRTVYRRLPVRACSSCG